MMAGTGCPVPDLAVHHAKLEWLVESWRDTGSFERFAHIRNLLSCFPELQPAFEDMLAAHGFAREAEALLQPLLRDALAPGEAAMAAFEARPLSVVATRELAEDLAAGLAAPGETVPVGDALYLAASARLLRRRLSGGSRQPRPPVRADALRALRAGIAAHPAATPPAPADIATLDGLRARKDAVSGVAMLRSAYAAFDPQDRCFAATLHERDKAFVHGPYLQLGAGRYLLELELRAARPVTLDLSARAFHAGGSRVLSARSHDTGPGVAVLRMGVDWPGALVASHLFEIQLRVAHPAMAALAVTGFRLRADRQGRSDVLPEPVMPNKNGCEVISGTLSKR